MTIIDTDADSHYGDKVKMAMAFGGTEPGARSGAGCGRD
jgi:hypothetical protein